MPRLRAPAADAGELARMLGGFAREEQRLAAAGGARWRLPMQVEIAFDLSPFLAKEMRKEKSWTELPPEPREEASASGRLERRRRVTVLGHQPRPDLDVAIFDRRETRVDVPLLRVGLDAGQRAVEKRGVGLVLPVMLERVKVGRRSGCHDGKYGRSRKWPRLARKPLGTRSVSDRIAETNRLHEDLCDGLSMLPARSPSAPVCSRLRGRRGLALAATTTRFESTRTTTVVSRMTAIAPR